MHERWVSEKQGQSPCRLQDFTNARSRQTPLPDVRDADALNGLINIREKVFFQKSSVQVRIGHSSFAMASVPCMNRKPRPGSMRHEPSSGIAAVSGAPGMEARGF
jgi:hypothetical protein